MKVETIAKLAPLTATKCVSPDLRISFLKVALCSDVSPNTIPGISAPLSPPPLAARSPSRIRSRDFAQREGWLTTVKLPLLISNAATRPSLLGCTKT